jgi:RHS repeat-associated protein
VDPNQAYAQVIGEYQNVVEQAWYTHGNDLLSQSRNGAVSYFHTDALGSTRALTDQGGNLSDSYAYQAFGEVDSQTGATENSYLFAGEQYDPTLGQYYLRDRYMDPEVGRFIQRDKFDGYDSRPITLHKYVYGNGDPANWFDPSGQMGVGDVLGAIGGFARLVASSTLNYTRLVASRVNGRVVSRVTSLRARLWLKQAVGQVQSRLPRELGRGTHSKAGDGWRWYSKKHSVRLQRGNPESAFPSQRVDYVKITSNGKVIGRNGKVVSSSSAEEAHIPLAEWRTWVKWDALL